MGTGIMSGLLFVEGLTTRFLIALDFVYFITELMIHVKANWQT